MLRNWVSFFVYKDANGENPRALKIPYHLHPIQPCPTSTNPRAFSPPRDPMPKGNPHLCIPEAHGQSSVNVPPPTIHSTSALPFAPRRFRPLVVPQRRRRPRRRQSHRLCVSQRVEVQPRHVHYRGRRPRLRPHPVVARHVDGRRRRQPARHSLGDAVQVGGKEDQCGANEELFNVENA